MRMLDLFAGIGGFSLAAHWMGWSTITFVEKDPFCQKVLAKNFPSVPIYDDVRTFDGTGFKGTVDIICGGFPCQDVSVANQSESGKKGLFGERTGLWSEYARIIREIRPRFVVFENSPNLIHRGLSHILSDLTRIGYDTEWRSFYATQFGLPHSRKRIYGLAYPNALRGVSRKVEQGILSKILPEPTPRQIDISMLSKRINGETDPRDIQEDDGFSRELDLKLLAAYGNSIIPEIAFQIFKAIEETQQAEGAVKIF